MTFGVGAFSEAPLAADRTLGGGTVKNEAVSETASLTDTGITNLIIAVGIASETLATAAEAWAGTAVMAAAVSESIFGTSDQEGTKATNSYDEPVSETVTVSDDPAALIIAVGIASETGSLGDTPAGLMQAGGVASESASLSDTPAALAAMLAALSEGVTVTDNGAVAASVYNVPISESVVVWDSPDATGGNGVPNVVRQGARIVTPGTLKATR